MNNEVLRNRRILLCYNRIRSAHAELNELLNAEFHRKLAGTYKYLAERQKIVLDAMGDSDKDREW